MATTQHLSDPFIIPGGNVDTNGKTSSQPGYKSNSPVNNTYKADIPTPTGQTAGTNPNNPVAVYRTGVTQPIGTITSQNRFIPNPSYLLSNTGGNLSVQELAIRKAEQRAIREKTIEINKQVIIPTAKKEKIDPPIKDNDAATPQDPSKTDGTLTIDQLNITSSTTTRPVGEYKDLRYPLHIDTAKSDVVKFTILEYKPQTLNQSGTGFGLSEVGNTSNTKYNRGGAVTMSVQPSVRDGNIVGWQDLNLSLVELALGTAAEEGIETGTLKNTINSAQEVLKDPNTGKGIITGLISKAASSKGGLFTRLTGAITNPNIELLFTGPGLREFSFTFKMSPREKDETDQVRQIIRFFKQGMSVQRSTTNLFLKTPNVFEIKYLYGKNKSDHPYLPKIKVCALIGCEVNYTPQNSYMTFAEDGSMVSYEMSLRFREIEPIYNDDYTALDSNSDTQIGY